MIVSLSNPEWIPLLSLLLRAAPPGAILASLESPGRLLPPFFSLFYIFSPSLIAGGPCTFMELDSHLLDTDLDGDLLNLSINDPQLPSFNEHTFIGQVIYDKVINFKAIKNILLHAWDYGSETHIIHLDRNKFAVSFTQVHAKNKVIAASSWAVKGHIVVLKQWEPDLALEELTFHYSPF